MQEAGIDKLDVTEEFLIGRVIASNIVDKDSGESSPMPMMRSPKRCA